MNEVGLAWSGVNPSVEKWKRKQSKATHPSQANPNLKHIAHITGELAHEVRSSQHRWQF